MSRNLIALQRKFLPEGRTAYDLLSDVFARQGYVSDEDIARIASEFQLPPQFVRSTAKFYDELSQDWSARHVVKVCAGEACRVAGSQETERALGDSLGSLPAGDVRIEEVRCLGYCGRGPNAMVDGLPVSLASPEDTAKVVAFVREGRSHGLAEPRNAVYLPAEGKPRVLMRHFDADVVAFDKARERGVYESLRTAVSKMTPQEVLEEIKTSQLRGRGGAGFPTGVKLQTVADTPAEDGSGRKFVVVNADEGDAGSYTDKELLERDPHTQLEGILIAAYACGAQEAVIYARFEYPRARAVLRQALEEARQQGLVGRPLFGSDFRCDVRIVTGQGAYICGEETALLRSIEGLPPLVSTRPPFPAQKGLWDCPTAVNNVETLHNLPWIVEHGGRAYARYGHGRSRGTKAVSINSRVRRPGMYEIEFGATLRELLFDIAGGMAEGHEFKAVQVGGPLGGILPERLLDTPLDFEALADAGGLLGHGGVVVYSHRDDLVQIARGLMHFCAVESCGKCFPCRIGSVRGTELFDQMMETGVTDERLALLAELCETLRYGSLCGLGGMLPSPIECLVEHFPEELGRYRR
jgi:formate dehydrogenase iron-sulfur subunit